jgi:methyl-accepting chemotaxis protein
MYLLSSMKKLFAPAIWCIGRLSYPHKLLITAATFLIPLLVLAGLLLLVQQKALTSTQRERAGLALQLPALELLAALHEHHAAIQAAFAGDAIFQQQIPKRRENVETALNHLRVQTEANLADRGEKTNWDELNEQWKALAAQSADAGDGLEAHLALNRLLRNGLTSVSDTSGIRVDGDPAIAALVDSVSIKLPLLVESLALARDIGLGAIVSQRLKSKVAQSSAGCSGRY